MATALLTINADAANALNVIQQLQNALNNLQNNANIQIGGNANQLQQINRGMTELTSLTNAWAAAITRNVGNALRDAFQEIRNIDDELVTIRRVTGRTGAELDALTSKATNVAKTYGIAASDYLKSVSSFSKAGYGEAADALGELSVKAQRVGDLTQEVADQFLLAVDKGYKFNGSIEQLSAVLDGANEIGNRFATDIDKIAAGLGKVAPIAAQAHVSIYELEAALGTITAVTQRSGTEAATALRALFLNIMGDTKTEIEDGAKWTAGEIEGLRDLLKIYASEVVEAAEKTGEVINPMEAIAALSKAYREGVLTEQALVSMVSDIGGKLRTTQLLALIQNWEMYTKMVETAINATGSADEEIGNSLDAITRKLKQLQQTWVAIVSNTISSRFIKDTIDLATNLLNAFGNLQTILTTIGGIILTLRGYRIAQTFTNIIAGLRGGGLTGFISQVGLVTTAISGLVVAFNYLKQESEKEIAGLMKTSQEAAGTSDSIYDLYMKVKAAAPGTDEYTAALARLSAQMQATGADAEALSADIDATTLSMLQRMQEMAAATYQELGVKFNSSNPADNPLNTWDTLAGWATQNYSFKIENAAKEIQNVIAENLSFLNKYGTYTLFKDDLGWLSVLKPENFALQFKDADELINTYEALIKTRDEIRSLVYNGTVDNTNNSVYSSEYYQDLTSMISALEAQYTRSKEALDYAVSTATNYQAAALQTTEYAKAWGELNNQIANGGEVDAAKRTAAMNEIIAFADKLDDGTLIGKGVKENIIWRLAEQFPELVSGIEEWQDVISRKPSENAIVETAEESTRAVKNLTDAISQATKAKNEFDKAMAEDAENADFQNYKEAYDAYTAELEAGRVNSKILKAAARYLLGDEAYNAAFAKGGYQGVNAAMKSSNLDLLYGEESGDYAEGFFKYLTKYANQAGDIVDANGRIVASMTNVGDAIRFQINDYQALSEKTGLPIHQLAAAVRALGVYGEIASPQIDTLKEQLLSLGDEIASYGEDGRLSVNYDALLKLMDGEALASGDWKLMKEFLNLANELGEIDLKNVTDGWLEADDAAQKAAESAAEAAQSTKEAASAQAGSEGIAKTTEQVGQAASSSADKISALNVLLDTIAQNQGPEAAAQALEMIIGAAEAAGAEIEAVDGKITSLTMKDGSEVTWEWMTAVISNCGTIQVGLDGILQKILEINNNPVNLEFIFDEEGALTEIITVQEAIGETPETVRTYFFGEDGNIVKVVDVVKEMVNGEEITKTTTTFYGADGGVTKVVEEVETGIEGVRESHTTFYGEDGNITSKVDEYTNDIDGIKKSTTTFYGADGNITKVVDAVENELTGISESHTYFYGEDGGLTQTVAEYTDSVNGLKTSTTTFYGKDGNITKVVEAVKNLITGEEVTSTTVYFYADDGEVITAATTIKDKNGQTIATYNVYFTDNGSGQKVIDHIDYLDVRNGKEIKYTISFKETDESGVSIATVTRDVQTLEGVKTITVDISTTGTGPAEIAQAVEDAQKLIDFRAARLKQEQKEAAEANGGISPGTGELVAPPKPKGIPTIEEVTAAAAAEEAAKAAEEAAEGAEAAAESAEEAAEEAQDTYDGLTYEQALAKKYHFPGADLTPRENTAAVSEQTDGFLTQLGNSISEWWHNATTADIPSWIAEEANDEPPNTVAEEVGEAVTDGLSAWWSGLTTAHEPSWLANVDINATGDAAEIAEVVESDGKTLKIGVDTVEKGNTEETVQALTGADKDNAVITKELEVEVSDNTQELMDGFYGLGAGDDEISMSLDVSTNEDGIKILKLIESYGNDDGLQVVTTFKVDEDGLIQIKEIQKIGDEISGEKQMTVTADTAEANSSIARLLNRLNQLKSKSITVTANVKGGTGTPITSVAGSSVGGAVAALLGLKTNASGTKHFGGGLSLINEEGPELITADGWARILANGKPTIANIPKGATIYTASETAQILNGTKQTAFPAFATGIGEWLSNTTSKMWDNAKKALPGLQAVEDAFSKLTGAGASSTGTVTIPPKKEEEKKDDTKKTTTSGGGSAKKDEAEFWDVIQKYIEYGLKKIQYQIDERQEAITALERERDKLMKPIDKELDELNWQIEEAEYRVKLIQRNRDDATKALKEQIDALKEAREIEQDEEQLEEKRLAVIEAQNALKDAQYDRTVRYYNEATGQWEWMADQSAVKNAEDALKDAEKAYEDALKDYEITQLERQVKAIEKMYDAQAKPYEDELEQYNRQVEDLQYQRNQIERQYASSIDPLQEAMDEIQQTYDDLDKYYNKVQDAIAVPMDDLEAALTAMQGAEANYANQFENVQSLLDTLYDLAPTWDAISVGALGMSAAAGAISNTNFADVLNNNGQTIIINGLSVEGDGTMSLNELIAKAGIYRNYNE